MIPVYMINGFLESGKSEFIKYTIAQSYFQSRSTTLLILCEEGEVEFEETIAYTIDNAAEVMVDKYTRQNPACQQDQHRAEHTQCIRQVLCARLAQFATDIVAYLPAVGNQSHRQRADNQKQCGTQREMVEVQ